MQEMVNVYFFGKKYSVAADLTIMTAMEYAGYTLKRRNPINAPTTAQVIGSIPLFVPIATTVKNVATRTVTLDARPSSPSVKFVPLTVPITAKKRTGIASHPRFNS